MCVEILLYSAILFTSKFTDHVITAKCPYDEIPGILNEETHSPDREVKKKYLYFVKPTRFLALLNFNHIKNNI